MPALTSGKYHIKCTQLADLPVTILWLHAWLLTVALTSQLYDYVILSYSI